MAASPAAGEGGGIRGWHVLAGILAFFGVIFAVNGVFLYSALKTHTGIVSKQPYRKGLDYNQRIAAEERQRVLGWSHEVALDAKAGRLTIVLKDRAGGPVSGVEFKGFVGRPSTERHDIALSVSETSTPGRYVANLKDIEAGNWIVQLEAGRLRPDRAEVVYRLKERLWLKR